jgi:hypothetical protein
MPPHQSNEGYISTFSTKQFLLYSLEKGLGSSFRWSSKDNGNGFIALPGKGPLPVFPL